MGRQVRDSRLDTREARLKLKPRPDREPYWRLIHDGLHLGYRKGTLGSVWMVRYRDGKHYAKKTIGGADDSLDSNGADVLSFREAQTKAIAIADTARNSPARSPLTVAEAATRYLEWYKEHRRAFRETEYTVKAHILPTFGETLVSELQSRDIKAWLNNLATHPARKRTRLGKKQQFHDKAATPQEQRARKSSANRILTVLKALLNKAFHDEMVNNDLAWRRVKPFENVDEPITRFLTEAESKRLINACRADFRPLVKAALFTGARCSELTRLKAANVNPDTATIYVQPSKSGRGRHVPLNNDGLDFFKAQIADKRGDELVFTKQDGNPWGKSHHIRVMQDACSTAKITPAIGFHELRHSYASLLAQAGVDLLTISKLLGHADTRVTSRHYAHLCDKTLANAVRAHLPGFGHKPNRKVAGITSNLDVIPDLE